MAKAAKHRHPLTKLRSLTPWHTQASMATAMGVEPSVVSQIESRKQRLSMRQASRLRELAGVDDTELLRGDQAALRTLEGKPYSAGSYAAWAESPRRKAEAWQRTSHELDLLDDWMRLLCDAALTVSPEKLIEARDLFTSGLDRVTSRLGLTGALNDMLVPWQICELAGGDSAWWKRQDPNDRIRMGWSAALSLPPRLPVTLSIQSAPVWHPGALPPGAAAPNRELFPPACAILSTDAGGDAAAGAFIESLCREHAIHPQQGRPLRHEPSASWQVFFSEVDGRHWPRAGLQTNPAAATAAARQSMAAAWYAGGLSGLFLFSTGAEMEPLVNECAELARSLPAVPIVLVLVSRQKQPVLPEALRAACAAILILPTPGLERMAERVWQSPGRGDTLAGAIMAAFAAPLRYGSATAPPLDLPSLLRACAPGQTCPVIRAGAWPLKACAARSKPPHPPAFLMAGLCRLAVKEKLITEATAAVALVIRAFECPGSAGILLQSNGRVSLAVHEAAVALSWQS